VLVELGQIAGHDEAVDEGGVAVAGDVGEHRGCADGEVAFRVGG
jgi:hypothetical protein